MQVFSLILLSVTLITVAILQPSNARAASYFQEARQHYDENQYRRMLMNLYVRTLAEDLAEDDQDSMETRDNSNGGSRIANVWIQFKTPGGLEVPACKGMSTVFSKTAEQCKEACDSQSNCNAIDYDPKQNGRCTFRNCNTQPSNTDNSKQYTSYIRRNSFFVWRQLETPGGLGVSACQGISTVFLNTAEQCEKACDSQANCNAIDYDPKQNGRCTFRNCNTQTPTTDSNKQYTSYIKQNSFLVWDQLETPGGLGVSACQGISTVFLNTAEKCADACDSQANCNAIDYDPKQDGRCTFRNCNTQTPTTDSNKQYTSYIRRNMFLVWDQLETSGGLDVPACKGISTVFSKTADQCKEACDCNSDCNAIDYDPKQNGRCTFRNCNTETPATDSSKQYTSYIKRYKLTAP